MTLTTLALGSAYLTYLTYPLITLRSTTLRAVTLQWSTEISKAFPGKDIVPMEAA